MPEGDTIHRLAARLGPLLVDREVLELRAQRIPDAVADEIVGRRVAAVEARGKNLLVRFEPDRVLHIHLRMGGRVFVERPRSRFWAARPASTRGGAHAPSLTLAVRGATVLGRDLAVCRLLTASQEKRALAHLGPDLVIATFDENDALARLRALGDTARARPIGDALLDQRAAAGIGNVYKSEVLFLEGVHPQRTVSSLDDDVLRALLRRASVLLQRNLGDGPRRTRPSLAFSAPRLWVYGRAHRPCLRCGSAIGLIRQGEPPGRSTYFCPKCQPPLRPSPKNENENEP